MKELLPVIRQAFPSANNYDTLGAAVVQANAEGLRVLVDNEHDIFVKRVDASQYATSKNGSWPDFRRTMMYLRTEVRFYKEIMPDLQTRGFHAAPKIYHADYDLDGLVGEQEKATDQSIPEPEEWSAEGKGGSIVMESIGDPYFQDSPITMDQAKETLSAVAALHASAWEDAELLEKAERWLSRGSYHLKTRNVKELAGMEQAWENFSSHFGQLDPALFERTATLGTRIQSLAEYISDQVSPGPTDSYATLAHGDFKSMNCFLPTAETTCSEDTSSSTAAAVASSSSSRSVVLVDFASTGVGLGMSDVAMHIHHAVLPVHLANGGEEELLEHYLTQLNTLLGRSSSNKSCYPKDVAMRHYRLAVADYFRFLLGRFWKSATPESFAKKTNSKNTVLMNRNAESALAFLDRVDGYVKQIEMEKGTE
jgi:hypothetical protein